MTTPKARRPVYFASLRAAATEFFNYARNPVVIESNRPITIHAIRLMCALLLLKFLLLVPIGAAMFLYKNTAELSFGVDIGGPDWGQDFWRAFVALGIIAPLIEETSFRGWLRGKPAALMAAMSILGWAVTLWMLSGAGIFDDDRKIRVVTFSLLWLITGVCFVRSVRESNQTPKFFRNHFAWFYWASSAAFAVLHVINYNIETWWLAVPMTAPQFLGGLILGFVRMHYGLKASMGMHAAFNIILVTTLFSFG